MSRPDVAQEDELARLRRENRGLEEQVKRLVRAERRLSMSQRVLEAQLQRVEVLDAFALKASRSDDEADILGLGLDVLLSSFAFEQAIGVLVDDGAARVAAARAVPGREGTTEAADAKHATDAMDATDAKHPVGRRVRGVIGDGPLLGDASSLARAHADAGPLFALLDATFGPASPDDAIVVVPVRSRDELRGALLARRTSPVISSVDPMPTPDDAPFLALLGAHVASAVDEVALFRAAQRAAEESSRRALENARLYQEARSAVQLRDEFLCVASHELKTPLTTLLLHVQRLRRSAIEEAALAPIERQARRLAALVDRLIDSTAADEVAPELALVELGALVLDVLEREADELARAGCEVRVDRDGPAFARVDPAQLSKALRVLLSNAAKFGGGAPIEVAIARDDAKVRLRVRDHGIGIARGDQPRVFDRFARVASYRHYGGLGMGLFAARRIVEALGGTIAVESEPGEGATFTIELPRAPTAMRTA